MLGFGSLIEIGIQMVVLFGLKYCQILDSQQEVNLVNLHFIAEVVINLKLINQELFKLEIANILHMIKQA